MYWGYGDSGTSSAAQDQVVIMREGKYGIAARVRPGLTGPAALYDYTVTL